MSEPHLHTPLIDKANCAHEHFEAQVKVARLLDAGKFMAEVTVRCSQCHEQFRFVGMRAGLNFDLPMVSIDGTEARLPIEPEGEARLHESATFVMPRIPERH